MTAQPTDQERAAVLCVGSPHTCHPCDWDNYCADTRHGIEQSPNPNPNAYDENDNPHTSTWTVYYYARTGTAWTHVQAGSHAQAVKNAKKRLGDKVYKVQLWAN